MSYFHFLGHPMNLKRCLSFLVVCVFTFFLALVPTSFFGINPETLEPIFRRTVQVMNGTDKLHFHNPSERSN